MFLAVRYCRYSCVCCLASIAWSFTATRLDLLILHSLWSDSAYGFISFTGCDLPFVLPYQSFHLYRRCCRLCQSIFLLVLIILSSLLVRYDSRSRWWWGFLWWDCTSFLFRWLLSFLLPPIQPPSFSSSRSSCTCRSSILVACITLILMLSSCIVMRVLVLMQEGFSSPYALVLKLRCTSLATTSFSRILYSIQPRCYSL